MKQIFIKCKNCGNNFERDVKNRLYCSKACNRESRSKSHTKSAREWRRKKVGTYDKWINELTSIGYIVINPNKKFKVVIEPMEKKND